jgi:HEPN domain-containing protein
MSEVQIHLVNVETKTPLPQSKIERTCHVEKQENSWTLYIQHDFGGRKNHSIFAKAVNEIMDGCLNEIGELSDMLSCDSPSQIPDVLNDHNVAIDHNEESEQLGHLVPNVYHYLMIQNPLCDFEEGTRVAYGKDEGGEKDWKEGEQVEESTKYTLAKILARANPIDKAAGEFDFHAEYKIDFGSKTEFRTISVLDIYSYSQDEMGNPVSDDNIETEVNILAEKINISRALNLAKKLESLFKRRKVLRRLFLHWFRCKDPKVADEMTTFIENEVTRLGILRVEETRFYTSYWRRRGRRERTTFSSYNHWMSYESSGHYYGSYGRVYSFREASEYVEPDPDEAERWIKQSKADLDATKMFLDKSYSLVCFLSQQCVEKVLKGVLYAKCGIPQRELRTHYIDRLASSVRRLEGAPSEVERASKVANYYLPTRYPDNQPKYRVPADEYSEEQAKEALEAAETVYTALEKFAHESDD